MQIAERTDTSAKVFAANCQKEGRFRCPACQGDVNLKRGEVRVPHFAHLPGADCPYGEPEGPEHFAMKYWALERWPGQVALEVGVAGRRRPDAILDTPDGPVALEFQAAHLAYGEWKERTSDLNDAGLPVLWIWHGSRFRPHPQSSYELRVPADFVKVAEHTNNTWGTAIFSGNRVFSAMLFRADMRESEKYGNRTPNNVFRALALRHTQDVQVQVPERMPDSRLWLAHLAPRDEDALPKLWRDGEAGRENLMQRALLGGRTWDLVIGHSHSANPDLAGELEAGQLPDQGPLQARLLEAADKQRNTHRLAVAQRQVADAQHRAWGGRQAGEYSDRWRAEPTHLAEPLDEAEQGALAQQQEVREQGVDDVEADAAWYRHLLEHGDTLDSSLEAGRSGRRLW